MLAPGRIARHPLVPPVVPLPGVLGITITIMRAASPVVPLAVLPVVRPLGPETVATVVITIAMIAATAAIVDIAVVVVVAVIVTVVTEATRTTAAAVVVMAVTTHTEAARLLPEQLRGTSPLPLLSLLMAVATLAMRPTVLLPEWLGRHLASPLLLRALHLLVFPVA